MFIKTKGNYQDTLVGRLAKQQRTNKTHNGRQQATHKTHINGTIIISESTRLKFFTNINAKAAVPSFPITAAGTKSLFLAYLARFAFIARPSAVIKPVSYTHLTLPTKRIV